MSTIGYAEWSENRAAKLERQETAALLEDSKTDGGLLSMSLSADAFHTSGPHPRTTTTIVEDDTLTKMVSPSSLNGGHLEDVYTHQATCFDNPEMLEISYVDARGNRIQEVVFLDPIYPEKKPRMCVSVDGVHAMHKTISVLSRKVDNLVNTLKSCRTAFLRQLVAQKEQIHQLQCGAGNDKFASTAKLAENTSTFFEPTKFEESVSQELLDKKVQDATEDLRGKLALKNEEVQRLEKRLRMFEKELGGIDNPRARLEKLLSLISSDNLLMLTKQLIPESDLGAFYSCMESMVSLHKGIDIGGLDAAVKAANAKIETLGDKILGMEKAKADAAQEATARKEEHDFALKTVDASRREMEAKLKASEQEMETMDKRLKTAQQHAKQAHERLTLFQATTAEAMKEKEATLEAQQEKIDKLTKQTRNAGFGTGRRVENLTADDLPPLVLEKCTRPDLEKLVKQIAETYEGKERAKLADVIVGGHHTLVEVKANPTEESLRWLNKLQPADLTSVMQQLQPEYMKPAVNGLPDTVLKPVVLKAIAKMVERDIKESGDTDSEDEPPFADFPVVQWNPIKDLSRKVRLHFIARLFKAMKSQEVKSLASRIPEKSRKNLFLSIFEKQNVQELKALAALLTTEEAFEAMAEGLGEEGCANFAPQLLRRLPAERVEQAISAFLPREAKRRGTKNLGDSDAEGGVERPARRKGRLDTEGRLWRLSVETQTELTGPELSSLLDEDEEEGDDAVTGSGPLVRDESRMSSLEKEYAETLEAVQESEEVSEEPDEEPAATAATEPTFGRAVSVGRVSAAEAEEGATPEVCATPASPEGDSTVVEGADEEDPTNAAIQDGVAGKAAAKKGAAPKKKGAVAKKMNAVKTPKAGTRGALSRQVSTDTRRSSLLMQPRPAGVEMAVQTEIAVTQEDISDPSTLALSVLNENLILGSEVETELERLARGYLGVDDEEEDDSDSDASESLQPSDGKRRKRRDSHDEGPSRRGSNASMLAELSKQEVDTKALWEQVFGYMEDKKMRPQDIFNIVNTDKRPDADGKNFLDRPEFDSWFGQTFNLSADDMDALWRIFDKDGSNSISYKEWQQNIVQNFVEWRKRRASQPGGAGQSEVAPQKPPSRERARSRASSRGSSAGSRRSPKSNAPPAEARSSRQSPQSEASPTAKESQQAKPAEPAATVEQTAEEKAEEQALARSPTTARLPSKPEFNHEVAPISARRASQVRRAPPEGLSLGDEVKSPRERALRKKSLSKFGSQLSAGSAQGGAGSLSPKSRATPTSLRRAASQEFSSPAGQKDGSLRQEPSSPTAAAAADARQPPEKQQPSLEKETRKPSLENRSLSKRQISKQTEAEESEAQSQAPSPRSRRKNTMSEDQPSPARSEKKKRTAGEATAAGVMAKMKAKRAQATEEPKGMAQLGTQVRKLLLKMVGLAEEQAQAARKEETKSSAQLGMEMVLKERQQQWLGFSVHAARVKSLRIAALNAALAEAQAELVENPTDPLCLKLAADVRTRLLEATSELVQSLEPNLVAATESYAERPSDKAVQGRLMELRSTMCAALSQLVAGRSETLTQAQRAVVLRPEDATLQSALDKACVQFADSAKQHLVLTYPMLAAAQGRTRASEEPVSHGLGVPSLDAMMDVFKVKVADLQEKLLHAREDLMDDPRHSMKRKLAEDCANQLAAVVAQQLAALQHGVLTAELARSANPQSQDAQMVSKQARDMLIAVGNARLEFVQQQAEMADEDVASVLDKDTVASLRRQILAAHFASVAEAEGMFLVSPSSRQAALTGTKAWTAIAADIAHRLEPLEAAFERARDALEDAEDADSESESDLRSRAYSDAEQARQAYEDAEMAYFLGLERQATAFEQLATQAHMNASLNANKDATSALTALAAHCKCVELRGLLAKRLVQPADEAGAVAQNSPTRAARLVAMDKKAHLQDATSRYVCALEGALAYCDAMVAGGMADTRNVEIPKALIGDEWDKDLVRLAERLRGKLSSAYTKDVGPAGKVRYTVLLKAHGMATPKGTLAGTMKQDVEAMELPAAAEDEKPQTEAAPASPSQPSPDPEAAQRGGESSPLPTAPSPEEASVVAPSRDEVAEGNPGHVSPSSSRRPSGEAQQLRSERRKLRRLNSQQRRSKERKRPSELQLPGSRQRGSAADLVETTSQGLLAQAEVCLQLDPNDMAAQQAVVFVAQAKRQWQSCVESQVAAQQLLAGNIQKSLESEPNDPALSHALKLSARTRASIADAMEGSQGKAEAAAAENAGVSPPPDAAAASGITADLQVRLQESKLARIERQLEENPENPELQQAADRARAGMVSTMAAIFGVAEGEQAKQADDERSDAEESGKEDSVSDLLTQVKKGTSLQQMLDQSLLKLQLNPQDEMARRSVTKTRKSLVVLLRRTCLKLDEHTLKKPDWPLRKSQAAGSMVDNLMKQLQGNPAPPLQAHSDSLRRGQQVVHPGFGLSGMIPPVQAYQSEEGKAVPMLGPSSGHNSGHSSRRSSGVEGLLPQPLVQAAMPGMPSMAAFAMTAMAGGSALASPGIAGLGVAGPGMTAPGVSGGAMSAMGAPGMPGVPGFGAAAVAMPAPPGLSGPGVHGYSGGMPPAIAMQQAMAAQRAGAVAQRMSVMPGMPMQQQMPAMMAFQQAPPAFQQAAPFQQASQQAPLAFQQQQASQFQAPPLAFQAPPPVPFQQAQPMPQAKNASSAAPKDNSAGASENEGGAAAGWRRLSAYEAKQKLNEAKQAMQLAAEKYKEAKSQERMSLVKQRKSSSKALAAAEEKNSSSGSESDSSAPSVSSFDSDAASSRASSRRSGASVLGSGRRLSASKLGQVLRAAQAQAAAGDRAKMQEPLVSRRPSGVGAGVSGLLKAAGASGGAAGARMQLPDLFASGVVQGKTLQSKLAPLQQGVKKVKAALQAKALLGAEAGIVLPPGDKGFPSPSPPPASNTALAAAPPSLASAVRILVGQSPRKPGPAALSARGVKQIELEPLGGFAEQQGGASGALTARSDAKPLTGKWQMAGGLVMRAKKVAAGDAAEGSGDAAAAPSGPSGWGKLRSVNQQVLSLPDGLTPAQGGAETNAAAQQQAQTLASQERKESKRGGRPALAPQKTEPSIVHLGADAVLDGDIKDGRPTLPIAFGGKARFSPTGKEAAPDPMVQEAPPDPLAQDSTEVPCDTTQRSGSQPQENSPAAPESVQARTSPTAPEGSAEVAFDDELLEEPGGGSQLQQKMSIGGRVWEFARIGDKVTSEQEKQLVELEQKLVEEEQKHQKHAPQKAGDEVQSRTLVQQLADPSSDGEESHGRGCNGSPQRGGGSPGTSPKGGDRSERARHIAPPDYTPSSGSATGSPASGSGSRGMHGARRSPSPAKRDTSLKRERLGNGSKIVAEKEVAKGAAPLVGQQTGEDATLLQTGVVGSTLSGRRASLNSAGSQASVTSGNQRVGSAGAPAGSVAGRFLATSSQKSSRPGTSGGSGTTASSLVNNVRDLLIKSHGSLNSALSTIEERSGQEVAMEDLKQTLLKAGVSEEEASTFLEAVLQEARRRGSQGESPTAVAEGATRTMTLEEFMAAFAPGALTQSAVDVAVQRSLTKRAAGYFSFAQGNYHSATFGSNVTNRDARTILRTSSQRGTAGAGGGAGSTSSGAGGVGAAGGSSPGDGPMTSSLSMRGP
eukprot:TRINITY_DN3057_c0_g1_i1.p1 TRINITY_DN3057_c0_g1~~TRINITY_DN3057_c0_g1_i1.p1  ORF type:complete len:3657 (-),score=1085.17 TRINITY_DN3057_c0_g1_i1:136-11106(-)